MSDTPTAFRSTTAAAAAEFAAAAAAPVPDDQLLTTAAQEAADFADRHGDMLAVRDMVTRSYPEVRAALRARRGRPAGERG